MEIGGTVYITCEKTGLQSEIEFKTKVRLLTVSFLPPSLTQRRARGLTSCTAQPYFGGGYNFVSGKIKEITGKKKTLYTISGKWDDQIFIRPSDTKVTPPHTHHTVISAPQ